MPVPAAPQPSPSPTGSRGSQRCRASRRGLLQFENASYGIEPLVNSPVFEHFIYQMSNENTAGFLFAKSRAESGARPAAQEMVLKIVHGEVSCLWSPGQAQVCSAWEGAVPAGTFVPHAVWMGGDEWGILGGQGLVLSCRVDRRSPGA